MSKLLLNKEIYHFTNIEAAIYDFQDCATITVAEQEQQFILNFSNSRADEELTIKEFENYVIGLENL